MNHNSKQLVTVPMDEVLWNSKSVQTPSRPGLARAPQRGGDQPSHARPDELETWPDELEAWPSAAHLLSFCFSATPLLGKSQTFPSTKEKPVNWKRETLWALPTCLVEMPARREGRSCPHSCPVEPCPMEQKLTNHPSIWRPIPSSTS